MQRVFLLAHKRFVKKVFNSEVLPNNFQLMISSFGISDYGSQIYHRLPREDFKTMLKITCPVSDPKQQRQIVQSSKRLRAHVNINEDNICTSCKMKDRCPFFKTKNIQKNTGAVTDLVNWLEGVNKMPNDQYGYKVWVSSLKAIDSFGEVIEDLKQGGNQFKIFDYERLRQSQMRIKELKSKQQSTVQQTKPKAIKKQAIKKPKAVKNKRETEKQKGADQDLESAIKPNKIASEKKSNPKINKNDNRVAKQTTQTSNFTRRESKNTNKYKEYKQNSSKNYDEDFENQKYSIPNNYQKNFTNRQQIPKSNSRINEKTYQQDNNRKNSSDNNKSRNNKSENKQKERVQSAQYIENLYQYRKQTEQTETRKSVPNPTQTKAKNPKKISERQLQNLQEQINTPETQSTGRGRGRRIKRG